MAKNISIDRMKRLREEPDKGHNRWHPDIPPVIEVEPGEEVTLETRDAMDLQIGPRTTAKDLEKMAILIGALNDTPGRISKGAVASALGLSENSRGVVDNANEEERHG